MTISVDLTEQELESLRERANIQGRSTEEVAREAVRLYIERRNREDGIDKGR